MLEFTLTYAWIRRKKKNKPEIEPRISLQPKSNLREFYQVPSHV